MSSNVQGMKNVLAVIIVGLVLLQAGCHWITWREFRPIKEENPITMFDRYELRLEGHASGQHNLTCYINFVDERTDTTKSVLDTIPIFIIDNICYEGDCLDSQKCYKPKLYWEILEEPDKSGAYRPIPPKYLRNPFPHRDLMLSFGKLGIKEYFLSDVVRLPKICKDLDISVTIFARLVDRVTGEDIASESKRIQFYIKKKTRPDMIE